MVRALGCAAALLIALALPPISAEQLEGSVAPPQSAEFDLDLGGLSAINELREWADAWQASRESEGKPYRVFVGQARILGAPGQNGYVEAFDLAHSGAVLDAHDRFISEIVANEINQVERSYNYEDRGLDEAQAEKLCQDSNVAKLSAKLSEIANALANKAIEKLGGDVDGSTNLARGIRCKYDLLVSTVSRATEVARQRAIRGARVLKTKTQDDVLAVAVAYGHPGVELADTIKAQRPASAPLATARSEIGAWVDKNMLAHPDPLDVMGIRSFKLSNGEWAVVSLGIAGIPGKATMSKTELAMRAKNAFPRSDVAAMGKLEAFAGAAVKSIASDESAITYSASLETEVRDGVATARVDQTALSGAFKSEITSVSRGKLRGVVEVRSGARQSALAKANVVYTVRAWSPSLVAGSREFDSYMSKNHAAPSRQGAPGDPAGQSSESPDMAEDW